MKKQLFLLFSLFTTFIFIVKAQSGSIDSTFTSGTGANGLLYTSSIQSDGRIIIGGQFTSYDGTPINRIARLNSNGTLDTSFNVGTGTNLNVYCSTIQNDGKIIIGGQFSVYNGTITSFTRINTNGTVDGSFNQCTANGNIYATSIQSDGKIIVGGLFTSFNGTASINHIVRLNTDGTIDTTFNVGLGTNAKITTIEIQNDGKIIIGGDFTIFKLIPINRVARLNSDGTLDTTFTVGWGANNIVNKILVQNDGKIIITGLFTSYNSTSINRIARLNTNGTLDGSYTVGSAADADIQTMAMQCDEKILIGGFFFSYDGTPINKIARLNTNGTLDTSFNVGTGANGLINTINIQSDGKVIIGGQFTSYNGTPQNRISRLMASCIITGINNEIMLNSSLEIYPNPTSHQLTIEAGNLIINEINIIGLSGKLIKKITTDLNTINVADLAKGIYFIKILANERTIIKKFVKQ